MAAISLVFETSFISDLKLRSKLIVDIPSSAIVAKVLGLTLVLSDPVGFLAGSGS